MQRLLDMLQQASDYVSTVVEGKLPADPHMGRKVGGGMSDIFANVAAVM